MRFSVCILALSLWISAASEAPKTWSEWFYDGTRRASNGDYLSAVQAFKRALIISAASNVDDSRLVDIVSALGAAYARVGEYREAEREWRRAVAMAKKTYGTDSLEYAIALADLSILPPQISNDESTITILWKAINTYRQTGAPTRLALVRGRLAEMLITQKKYEEAETLLLDWQADVLRLRTPNRRQLAELLNYLGGLRYQQRRFVESVQSFRGSLDALESDLGPEHPALVSALNNLATSLARLGRLDEASGAFERASSICSKTLGSDHPTCGAILGNYAPVLRKLGRKHEAEAMAETARQILQASGHRNGLGAVVSFESLKAGGKRAK